MTGDTNWQKATKSGAQGDCVELRRRGNAIQVRDSKHPEGSVLNLGGSGAKTGLQGAKSGEFDALQRP